MTSLLIFGTAIVLYALFWLWYVGLGRKINPALLAEVEQIMAEDDGGLTDTHKKNIRHFLENDDGKDFVMVNLLLFKSSSERVPRETGNYRKVFLGALLRKSGGAALPCLFSGRVLC